MIDEKIVAVPKAIPREYVDKLKAENARLQEELDELVYCNALHEASYIQGEDCYDTKQSRTCEMNWEYLVKRGRATTDDGRFFKLIPDEK